MSNPAVPVLDFAQRGEPAWLAALDHACQDWGCFQLGNHGLDSQLCQAVLTAMQQFFALSVSEKRSLERTEDNPWGFYDRELTKNVPDWKQIFDVGLTSAADTFHGASTPWPALSGFRETMEAYFAASHELALMLLADIGECLGAERGTLEREFGDAHSSFLRLNYYPLCDRPEDHLGISHHTDAGALTVLLPDSQPGLEFFSGDNWHLVEPEPGALIINIGDIVQVWSNDRYPAPLHRVRANADQVRYSAPYFLNPSYDTVYAPLPGALQEAAPRYRPINWGEFRAGRAAGDYADLGDEVQIADFRNPG